MEKRLRKPVATTFNCPGLNLLACIRSLIIGEYTNQIFSTMFINDNKIESLLNAGLIMVSNKQEINADHLYNVSAIHLLQNHFSDP